MVLAISIQHLWTRRKAVSLKELRKTPFILREEGSGTLKILDAYLRKSGENGTNALQVSARFGSSTAVKEGIKSGLGLSILSARAIDMELKAGILKALKVRGLSMSRNFFLIRNKMRVASPLCQAMLNFLLTTTEAYGIVPESLLIPVAIALPALEAAAGIGLLFDIKGSLAVIAGLLGLFIAMLGYGIFIGLDVDCGCFGPEDPEAEAFHSLKVSLYPLNL